MRCPKCGYAESKVADTRAVLDSGSIRRRRLCLKCGHKFFTNEIICEEFPIVVKRDGRKEEFNSNKVKAGLLKAFKKSAEIGEKVEDIYNGVIGRILSNHPEKIGTEEIGAIVMDLLKVRAPAAYMRFASVYKNFETVGDFAFEFKKLSSKKDES
jgi:transcriptional repressor NrdR